MTRVCVHRRTILDGSGAERVERLVECPSGRHSVPVEACGHCGFGRLELEDEELGPLAIDCERAETESTPRQFAGTITIVPAISLATRDVMCVSPDTPIDRVRSKLIEAVIECLPVVDPDGKPVGVIGPVDLMSKPGATIASSAMTCPVATIDEMTPMTRAAAVMAYEGIHHLLIVNDSGALIGVLSSLDVLRHVGQDQGYLMPKQSRRRHREAEE
ncbi:MAG: CBS domain-containing protein [Polyangiaceae bacterium]|jgi:CBS domain-containing protein|nr:CBS domain-containing protein [Polyangiaceae bacterium]MBK8937258.1 CBS domain-containing protein [Polyangiaceae bacterium]